MIPASEKAVRVEIQTYIAVFFHHLLPLHTVWGLLLG